MKLKRINQTPEHITYVSNEGKVYTTYNNNTPVIRVELDGKTVTLYEKSMKIMETGYVQVVVTRRQKLVHRLVAEAFVPRIEGKNIVNHKDGNKMNNHYTNLEWCTQAENIAHSIANGTLQSSHQGFRTELRCTRCGQTRLYKCIERFPDRKVSWNHHSEFERVRI